MARGIEVLRDRLIRHANAGLSLDAYARAVCDELRREMPMRFACFAATDPVSGLVAFSVKTDALPCADDELVRLEFTGHDINRFSEIAEREQPVGSLWIDTDGHPEACRRYAEFLYPRLGFTDELRAAFRVNGLTWGVLGMYRDDTDSHFTHAERDLIAAASTDIALGIQRSLFRTTEPPKRQLGEAPAVLVVSDGAVEGSPAAWGAIDDLGGYEHGQLPMSLLSVINVIRQGAPAIMVRARGPSGRWHTVQAAPLAGGPAGTLPAESSSASVVVSITPSSPSELAPLALQAFGLTPREQDVARLVLQGASTAVIAESLFLSPLTVQDHLKSIFKKVDVPSRRDLISRLVGVG